MALSEMITQRIAYNSAALATMGTCARWDAALSRFLAAHALCQADLEFGVLSERHEEAALARCRLTEQYGPN